MKRRKKLGLAFPDELLKVRSQAGHFKKKLDEGEWADNFIPNYQPKDTQETISVWRRLTLSSIFLLIFFGLFLRLFHLQVVLGKQNRERADFNRIQVKVLHAPRGVIFDRSGKVLAENSPGFRLKDQFIGRDQALELEAKNDTRFNDLEVDTIRSYPLGSVTSHILGYVGQISAEEFKKEQFSSYKIGDRVGRAGIEQTYEYLLKGKDGAEIIEVDAQGEKLTTLRKVDPIPGKNIYLSIDADLQKQAMKLLQDGVLKASSCCGAMVAEDPKTGEILALASIPSYDANAFTDPKRNQEVTAYFNDPNSPMLNRVIAGTYPPGSTFKIISALAALSSGKITSQTEIEDTGVMSLGPYQFANWYFTQYGRKEGMVDITKALQRSNDIFFYHVGQLLGEKTLGEVAGKMGLGKKLGIDLPGEVDGLIPTGSWKEKTTGQPWYPGDNLHMAIGQGFTLTTPLQILAVTSFVGNNGALIEPHLVVKATYPDGSLNQQFRFEPIVKDLFKKEDLALVKKGLSLVPKDGGTAWPFFSFAIPTAGKTGTAEFGDPKDKTHAWYTSFAPLDNPQIALTVLVEAGGEGSSVSAPIAKEVYTWYFNPDKNHPKSLDTFEIATQSAKVLGE
ncbi:penicillin-binding protein 2 [Candidatus Daviesbacteria bacterium]|nr:penicillin-binding protein 2 [Candidatus Daviesbacteria bacterium]